MPKKNQTVKCKWRSCDHVPCGKTMPHCPPQYCYEHGKISSRNWNNCNMKHLGNSPYHKKKCTKEWERFKSCLPNKSKKKLRTTVDVRILHAKMPYIWRFLRPSTRKRMVELANMKVEKINIPFPLYGERVDSKHKKRRATLRRRFKGI